MEPCEKYSGPCYSIADCMGAKRFLYRIGLLFTLHHCNPVHAAEQKSLHFVGDTKSNPVCAILEKAKCKSGTLWVSICMFQKCYCIVIHFIMLYRSSLPSLSTIFTTSDKNLSKTDCCF